MRTRCLRAAAGLLTLAAIGCGGISLGRQYEYEEQLYLGVDGAATVVVDASIPALVALRGLPLDPSYGARTDRGEIRRVLEAAGCTVDNVGQGWRRRARRFVQFRISTDDVRTLSRCGVLGWSSYAFEQEQGLLVFRQVVGAPAARDPGQVNWDGSELVAFKLHLPSRIHWHNVRRLEDNATGEIERGNILTWEQRFADRRAGQPITIEARMDETSILLTTLWLFGGAFAAAVLVLISLVWWVRRRGRRGLANTAAGNG